MRFGVAYRGAGGHGCSEGLMPRYSPTRVWDPAGCKGLKPGGDAEAQTGPGEPVGERQTEA